MNLCFCLEDLPGISIKAAFHNVHEGEDFRIHIALADETTFTLLQVCRAPRSIEVVHCKRPCLCIHAGAHLFSGPDQYTDATLPYSREQWTVRCRGFCIMDKRDSSAGRTPASRALP